MERGEVRSRIEKLDWAEDHLRQAIEYIAEAVEGTSHQRNVEAYTIAHLRNWKDGENPYDTTIPKIREWLRTDGDPGESDR